MRVIGKAIAHPERAVLRLVLMARVASRSAEKERDRLLNFLSEQYCVDARTLHADYLNSDFAAWFQDRRKALYSLGTPYRLGTTPDPDCEAVFLAVRAARPKVVVETGVLYGASSAHILEALAQNEDGRLYSIELGAAPTEPPHDFLVPGHLKERWQVIFGDSRRELPALLAALGRIDFFHHDSLHTSEHMRWEYETAFRYMRPGGTLCSDDVLITHSLRELGGANAFSRFCERHDVTWGTFGNVGLALNRSDSN